MAELDFPGYAVGGLSVGETPADMVRVLEATVPALPPEKPRYLMGVGRPQDLLEAMRRGIDLFDCVLPTRNARNAMAFTGTGPIRLRNQQFERDPRPLEAGCPCVACRHSRGYLRHLFMSHEMLGPVLVSQHNITYYQRLMSEARVAICQRRYDAFAEAKLGGLETGPGLCHSTLAGCPCRFARIALRYGFVLDGDRPVPVGQHNRASTSGSVPAGPPCVPAVRRACRSLGLPSIGLARRTGVGTGPWHWGNHRFADRQLMVKGV